MFSHSRRQPAEAPRRAGKSARSEDHSQIVFGASTLRLGAVETAGARGCELAARSVEDSFAKLKSAPRGLSADEAARRLAQFGPNELRAAGRVSAWATLVEQFKNVLVVIMLPATALSAFLGHGVEAIAITVMRRLRSR